jgi:hypothetical protein
LYSGPRNQLIHKNGSIVDLPNSSMRKAAAKLAAPQDALAFIASGRRPWIGIAALFLAGVVAWLYRNS